jgi:uncharacterized membrane protein
MLFATLGALFFLLTTGVPLVQWHLIPALATKMRYVRLMQIATSVYAILVAFFYYKDRLLFNRLWVVQWARLIVCRVPLKLTLLILSFVYSVSLSAVIILRHVKGETGADLAIFVQALWNSTRGDFLYSSIKDGICLLGDHVSPVLVLLVPFYSICPRPELLLILQAFATGSCVYLVGILAKDKLERNGYAVLFALMFFFYLKARMVATIEDFHPEVLVEPFMILAFFYLEKGAFWPFLASLILVISGKENMLGISFALGIYAFAFKKDPWRFIGFAVAILSTGLFLFEYKWLMPHLLNGQTYAYSYYTDVTHAIFSAAGARETLRYVFGMYSPLAFLPFLHFPTLFLTFPILLQNILSSNETMRSFNYHYTAGLHGFLFISSIYAFHSLTRKYAWLSRQQPFFMGLVFYLSLLCSGASEYFYFWSTSKIVPAYSQGIADKLKEIPSQFSVLADGRFVFSVIHRKHFSFLDNKTPPNLETLKKYGFDYVIFDKARWRASEVSVPQALSALKELGYWLEFEEGSFCIFKKI